MKILSEEERKSEEHGRVERTDDRGAEEGRGRRSTGQKGRRGGAVEAGPRWRAALGPRRVSPRWVLTPHPSASV